MKSLSFLLVLLSSNLFGQVSSDVRGYLTYEEFSEQTPSLSLESKLEERSSGDVFMSGGITNYRSRKVKPKELKNQVIYELWGITQDGKTYINAFPYSERKGYNELLGTGLYRYFVGEPAYKKSPQIELGFIKAGDPLRQVCCKTGFVLLPSGKVRLLTPELLLELIAGEAEIHSKAQKAYLKQKDTLKMFEFLEEYNLSKNLDWPKWLR